MCGDAPETYKYRGLLTFLTEGDVCKLISLVSSFSFGDALVDRFASSKAFTRSMPVRDSFFPKLPAKQNGTTINFAREIEKTDLDFPCEVDEIGRAHV